MDQFVATYNSAIASYRQTVLTAFQQVEDNLAGVRILSHQEEQEKAGGAGVGEATQVSRLSRYETGIDPYLNVVTAQTSLLSNQQALLAVQVQEITSAVQLIAALGGGWDRSPTADDHAGFAMAERGGAERYDIEKCRSLSFQFSSQPSLGKCPVVFHRSQPHAQRFGDIVHG